MDEFDRLELINQTVTRAKLISDEILSDVKSVGELVNSAVEIEASARLLAQNVTTLSLSILSKRSIWQVEASPPSNVKEKIFPYYCIYTAH